MPALSPPDPPLRGQHIALRLPSQSDAGWIMQACQDPEMNRWMPNLPAPDEQPHAVAHIEHTARQWAAGEGAIFVIGRPDATGIGLIELRLLADDHGSIGYWIA